MKGPKPSSNIVKMINGAGHKPINQDEPQYSALCLHPPVYLHGDALAKWQALAPKMEAAGVLKDVDADALAAYCLNHAVMIDASAILQHEQITIKTDRGGILRHPAYDILDKATTQMRQLSVLLGLDPCSRTRLVAPKKREKNEFDDI